MMILSREITKEIESHFYNHQQERFEIDERIQEIAESSGSGDGTGIRGSDASDPTAIKAAQVDRELHTAKAWVRVVQATFEKFKGTQYAELINMVFVERLSPTKIYMALYIGETTFFAWKSEVIQYAAMKACEYGILSV